MNLAIFILTVAAIYVVTRGLLAMLARELRARLQDSYRFVGPLVTPVHWVLLLASVLIAMSLMGLSTERFILLFYLAIAWFVFRAFTIILFEWWFATVKGISLPGVARRLLSAVLAFAAVLAFLRFRLNVRADDLAIVTAVIGLVVAVFFQGFLRDFFLGISMALEKPIRVGDRVAIDGHEGRVEAVDWKTTTLRGDGNERIVLPNRRIAEGIVTHGARDRRRRDRIEVSAPADTPPSAVLEELASAVAESPHVLNEPPPHVYYRGEHGGEGRFEASFWLPDSVDPDLVRSDLHAAIWHRFRRSGLILERPAFESAREHTRDALSRLPFLASATPAQIDRLALGVRSARYGKGEILFRQNDPGDELFLISSGSLDVFVANGRKVEEKIASVGVGSFVGERSLLTGEPRSATARAGGDCSVFVVGKVAMGELCANIPRLRSRLLRPWRSGTRSVTSLRARWRTGEPATTRTRSCSASGLFSRSAETGQAPLRPGRRTLARADAQIDRGEIDFPEKPDQAEKKGRHCGDE
jgi:small-conductance mechanosensitive channel